MNKKVLKGAIISGIINGVINGIIQYFSFSKHEEVPITVDSITNSDFTVLGEAVHLSVILAMVLTFASFFSIQKEKRPSFGKKIWLIFKHGFFTFGLLTGLAVLWQYRMGSVMVDSMMGVLLVAFIASLVSAFINYITIAPFEEPAASTSEIKYTER